MLSQLLIDLQTALAAESALDTTTILGYPNLGRTEPTLPIVAVVWQRWSYARQPTTGAFRPRLGQVQPAGRSIDVMVYLFASNEYNLLALCDRLDGLRASLSYVESDGVKHMLTYADVQRSDLAGPTQDERLLAYMAECMVTLTSIY